MAQSLPSSLSPHIAILTSPDLDEVVKNSSLPSLPFVLQSFSPFPKVTTRTTTLVSVPHNSFSLRFSDLLEIEEACREDDSSRAERALDWISARISHRSPKWVHDIEKAGDREDLRTPWWEELRRCVDADFVPSKFEGWNHPVALIHAVSTTAPNPLHAITALHSRAVQLPSWVDTNYLRCTLIIHPQGSSLSDEEVTALLNAVKKQFGLHSYLLTLGLPKPPPPPVLIPAPLPRLPPAHTLEPEAKTTDIPSAHPTSNTLCLTESDINQTARFAREFLVMSLVPWMEKCVLEWSENFSSTRRLPSRLFSSTRRLFGTTSPSPSPTPIPSSGPTRSMSISASNGDYVPPSQIRRLAEFATILGDIKLAVMVWEALRKESKGGSDILPLLLSPTVTTKHHAQAALMGINTNLMNLSPHEQMRVLQYAVRWESSIPAREFLSDEIEGERWLVWAAGNAEEAPAALLLAQAALLSTKKHTWRRAALWYFIAANRLEKCGIKPLTMYFLVKSRELYSSQPQKELSPSFWSSEGKYPVNHEGLEEIMSGIEHPLGRLLYTTGDVAGAVKVFLGLLRGSSAFISGEEAQMVATNEKVYIDDFRVALNYLKSTDSSKVPGNFEMPFKICVSKHCRPRYPGDTDDNTEVWSSLQEDWNRFWKKTGSKETLSPAGNYTTNELFWVDLSLLNPFDVDITLTNLTLVVEGSDPNSSTDIVEVETIKVVLLHARESSTIPISLKSTQPAKLRVIEAIYDFLSLLPTKESLSCRGRRLQDTPLQRQSRVYAPDTFIDIDVLPSEHKLTATFARSESLNLVQGETVLLEIVLFNSGSNPIGEIWVIEGAKNDVCLEKQSEYLDSETKILSSDNSLQPRSPQKLQKKDSDETLTLQPGDCTNLTVTLHADSLGTFELCLMFVYRKHAGHPLFSTPLSKTYHVESLFDISAVAHPSSLEDRVYTLEIEATNSSLIPDVYITDVVCVSPQWECHPVSYSNSDYTIPSQSLRLVLGVSPWLEGKGGLETLDFVSKSINRLLKGSEPEHIPPPPIDLLCVRVFQNSSTALTQRAPVLDFVHSGRRRHIFGQLSQNLPLIPAALHPTIFPLYNPAATDFYIFWEIPSQNRSGHTDLYGITLGARHGVLDSMIEDFRGAKGSRNMYAETRRENMLILESVRQSEWNYEMDPLVLSIKNSGSRIHNFSSGPCYISVEFVLRNHSLSLPARYTLKLHFDATTTTLPVMFIGRRIFRGELAPCQVVSVKPQIWVTRPGTYSLGGWLLETEVTLQVSGQRTRKRKYSQRPSSTDNVCVVVRDSRTIEY